ncbi:V-type proton ATPase subunit S1-like [Bacillus rossius redtenbacheri]|uniref:V-type proton ATPase subunit S1-like n=1 Tax=Bacillus rossius redtenbacheri TaxID=93214 RepID=UPI002FDEA450
MVLFDLCHVISRQKIVSKMSFWKSCVLVAICLNYCNAEYLPVLFWSSGIGKSDYHGSSAFEKVSSDNLYDYIKKTTSNKKPLILVFTEESLSLEDFSWRDFESKTAFPCLENVTSSAELVKFFPSVHAPLRAIKNLRNDGYEFRSIHLQDESIEKTNVPTEASVVIVKLDDAKVNEDRPDLLRRHDETICDAYSYFVEKGVSPLVMYTGHHSSWVEPEVSPSVRRVRRLLVDADDNTTTSKLWVSNDTKLMLYTSEAPYIERYGEVVMSLSSSPERVISDDRPDEQKLIVTFTGGITLRLKFPVVGGYWSLKTVVFLNKSDTDASDVNLNTTTDIVAPYNFSYHCNKDIVFTNGNISIVFKDLQVQPFLQKREFGDAYDCVWFFTGAIWSGLFVTALFALIMMWGLSMIMNIKTMDQFDDPKGKTITVTATD